MKNKIIKSAIFLALTLSFVSCGSKTSDNPSIGGSLNTSQNTSNGDSVGTSTSIGNSTNSSATDHVHSNLTYDFDSTHHWHECDGCEDIIDKEAHSFTSQITRQPSHTMKGERKYECECGYFYLEEISMINHSHSSEWKSDATHHWHECECGDKKDIEAHDFFSGFCTKCGKQELATGITISQKTLELYRKETHNLTVTVLPAVLQNLITVSFTSNKETVATVDATGKITAVGEGTATITAKAEDGSGKTDTMTVTVYEPFSNIEDVIANGIENQKFVVVGRVVAVYGKNIERGIFIANGNYGIQVYQSSTNVSVGDLVQVTGTYHWYSTGRSTELTVSSNGVKVITSVPEKATFVEPVEYQFNSATWDTITASTVGSESIYANRPITVTGTVVEETDGNQIEMTVDGKDVVVHFQYSTNDIKNEFATFAVGDEIVVSGVVGSNNGNTRILAPGIPTMKQSAKLTIGTAVTKHDTLKEAIQAAPTDGTQATIELLKNATGVGCEVVAGQNIILDLGGNTYSVGTPTVGSPGTETNGLRFVKGSTVVIKNGTVDCAEDNTVAILIQKYNDLTLENVTIDSRKGTNSYNYAVSNNAGTTTFKGNTKIIARDVDGVAFDLCYFQNYTDGVKVIIDETFTGSFIGKIEYANYPTTQTADWYKSTLFVKAGREYTVNNASEIAHKTERSYENYDSFLADLVIAVEEIPNEPVTTTKTIAELATQYGWTNNQVLDSFKLDDVVTIGFERTTFQNSGKYQNSGKEIRVYGTDSGKITISVPTGYELESLTITYSPDTKGDALDGCASGAVITFADGITTAKYEFIGTKHVRITKISVTYLEI